MINFCTIKLKFSILFSHPFGEEHKKDANFRNDLQKNKNVKHLKKIKIFSLYRVVHF